MVAMTHGYRLPADRPPVSLLYDTTSLVVGLSSSTKEKSQRSMTHMHAHLLKFATASLIPFREQTPCPIRSA
jgi:hypothetical protein